MERTNLYEPKFENSRQIEFNKSVFMSQAETLRKDRDLQTKSVRNLGSAASHLNINNERSKLGYSRLSKNIEQSNSKEDVNRPLSIKGKQLKVNLRGQSIDKSSHEDFNSHLVKLKIEEMVFKFKSRIGTLLKEINISLVDLNRFASLARIDDILNFLSEKVKEKLVNTEISQNNVTKIRSKERQLLSEYQTQIQSLKKRIVQKQNSQKANKNKLKQNHNELRQLYDKLNVKQKELSIKITQLYQNKMLLKQNEKLIETIQSKVSQLQKQRNQLREQSQNDNKNMNSNNRQIQQQNQQLKQQNQSLKQLLQMAAEKQSRLIQFNKNMVEEVARWRERFQQQRQKISQKEIVPIVLKPENVQPNQLLHKIQQLSNQIKKLNKEVKNLEGYKEKYEDTIELYKKQNSTNSIENYTKSQVEISSTQKSELQLNYAKKMQLISTQWRDKLIEIVDSYAADQQKRKQQIDKLNQQKNALQIKIYTLANEKYQADCRIIQKETQIYQLTKGIKMNKANELPSEQLLLSSPLIQPQQYAVNKQTTLIESRQLSSNQYSYKSQM